jgi:hypothetical protein
MGNASTSHAQEGASEVITPTEALSTLDTLCKAMTGVDGLEANSTSFSDTWIVHLRPGVELDGEPVREIFAKMWMDKDSILRLRDKLDSGWAGTWKREVPRYPDTGVAAETPGLVDFSESTADRRVKSTMSEPRRVAMSAHRLEYEAKVHAEVIQPLLDHGVCPNFPQFIASKMVNGRDLYNGVLAHEGLTKAVALQSFVRSVLFIAGINRPFQGGGVARRPAVHVQVDTDTAVSPAVCELLLDQEYRVLFNQCFPPGYRTLARYLKELTKPAAVHELWTVLFQVLAGCYALNLSQTAHLDLHLNNIVVGDHPHPGVVVYRYADGVYRFHRGLHVQIFDFDYAYACRLGANPGSKRNYLHPFADIYKVCRGVYNALVNRHQQVARVFLRTLTDTPATLHKSFGQRVDVRTVLRGGVGMYSPELILEGLATHLVPAPEGESGLEFECNPDRFSDDGRVCR